MNGVAPKCGQVFRNPGLAKVLESLTADSCSGFYAGETAKKIVSKVQSLGGKLELNDLAQHSGTPVDSKDILKTEYRGKIVCEMPPNGQGIVVSLATNLLKHFTFTSGTYNLFATALGCL